MAAAVECLFASINPVAMSVEKLTQAMSQALASVAALPPRSTGLWRSSYAGLAQLFEGLTKVGERGSLSPDARDHLKTLLFGPDPGTEALRLLRADAIVAMAKAMPTLASALHADVLALVGEEKSKVVRDRLASAPMQRR